MSPFRMNYLPSMNLLLIGKTGNGKSATGNTILGYKAFRSASSTSSVTTAVQSGTTFFKGRIIRVVDSPGVGDTNLNSLQSMDMIKRSMERAVQWNTRGFHAFLLVVRFGGRFTQEDRDAVVLLKTVFGNDFLRKYCVLVMTCGDNFEDESRETGITFREWCEEQRGIFKVLMNECNHRIVLFNNMTKNEHKINHQKGILISMIDSLGPPGHCYIPANFEQVRRARDREILEARRPVTQRRRKVIIYREQATQTDDGRIWFR